jgi:TolA-binding protein
MDRRPNPLPRLLPGASLACLLAVQTHAQRPAHYEHRNADLAHALDLFAKAKYGPAAYELDRVVQRINDPHDGDRVHAEYYRALCAVRLFNDDAGIRLRNFLNEHPESHHAPELRFEVFKHEFGQRRWKEALAWSERVDRFLLEPDELEEFRFKRGYAWFQTGERDKALGEFAQSMQGEGLYAAPSRYYAAHIHYERGEYETALQAFEKLKSDETFGRIVPFYIAEILFLQGKYEELDAFVTPLLNEQPAPKRINEINRLAGEANYRQGKYEEALPYLKKSAQRTGVERPDRYILGFTYLRTGDCPKAIAEFNLVANGNDSLAQLATYHMGECYLKMGEKNFARNAFKRSHELGFDRKVAEDALFQYAKLSYELSIDPYHEAIQALRNYLKAYPDTPRRDEAYEFLLNVYLRTRNYEAALEALDEIKNLDLRLREAYQKLAYDRGVELFEGGKFAEAVKAFERSLRYPVDQRVRALAHYWMAESYYGAGDFRAALRKYDDLRNSPGAYTTELYEQAGYGMGYAFFKLKEYDEAATAFRRFINTRQGDARQRADAMMRTGDAYFVMRDNVQALKWYTDAAALGGPDRDYAIFQQGVCLGLMGRHAEKITALRGLLSAQPNSRHAADAKFQLGEAYITVGDDNEAMRHYTMVVEQHPNSPHVRQAMLQSALLHRRRRDHEKAIAGFKAVVAKFPTMEGSRDALAGLESIYMELGRLGEYETYLRSLSFVDPATLELDEKYYQSAERLYFDENCAQAIGAFGDYIAKYPRGAYVTNALFYRGDCRFRAGRFDEAVTDLEDVIARGAAQFAEEASAMAADIRFRQKRWEAALEHFTRLEQVAGFPQNRLNAQVGRMRCLNELGRRTEAAAAAETVAANPDASNALKSEAGLLVAKGLLDKADYDAAYARLRAVVNADAAARGAEAKYLMAFTRYMQGRYRDAEKEVFELVQRYPSYDHWKARAFILLGDVYVRLGDLFQAKATLQSVVDHSNESELVAEARKRLDDIRASEAPRTQGTQEDIEIELPGNDRRR